MSAGQTWGSTDIVAQAQDSGRVATAWESVTTVAARSDTPKPLVDAVNTAKAFFSGPLADERATIARALSSDQKPDVELAKFQRSEERRVGKECVSTCRSRWWPYH